MNNKKITAKMISLMSKQSLKSSRMRNIFVMITIVLAAALLPVNRSLQCLNLLVCQKVKYERCF